MQPLFPAWTNSVARVSIALLIVAALGVPVLLMVWVRTPYVTGQFDPLDQPLQFDHRHHVRDVGIDCRYCHTTVDRSPNAGVPPTQLCMNCHSQIWNGSLLLEPLRRSYFTGDSIRWQRVHSLPDFVFFNHSVHVQRGVGCESCHGRVDLMGTVYATQPLTMGWCLDCHREPAAYLRPQGRITEMGYRPSAPQEQIGREIQAQRHVAPPTNCTACHR